MYIEFKPENKMAVFTLSKRNPYNYWEKIYYLNNPLVKIEQEVNY